MGAVMEEDIKRWTALRTKPLEVREEYERQIKGLQEAYGGAMIEEDPAFGYRTHVGAGD